MWYDACIYKSTGQRCYNILPLANDNGGRMQNNHTTPRYKIDMVGKVFGNLTVVEYSHNERGGAFWLCRCMCGNEKVMSGANLRFGHGKSCGCLTNKMISRSQKEHGESIVKKVTPEYRAWLHMRTRCNNPSSKNYSEYGGRGIKVCERWNDYTLFLDDMGRRPSPEHSVDRIDVNGNYEPSNCRWATQLEQQQNRRDNVVFTLNGETHCVREWERMIGVGNGTVWARLKSGWSVERALTTKSRGWHKVNSNMNVGAK